MWPAHRAEVRDLRGIVRQGLVVEEFGRVRIERQVELVLPAKLEAGLRERVVSDLCARVAFGQIRCVSSDLVGDDAGLHVFAVGEA